MKLINIKNDNIVKLHYFTCFIHLLSTKQYAEKKNVPIVPCVANK